MTGISGLYWWVGNARIPDRVEAQWDSWTYPYRQWILKAIGPAKSLYEVGCGVGANLRLIQKHRPDIRLGGSDGCWDYCAIAQERLGLEIDEIIQPSFPPPGWDALLYCYVLSYLAPKEVQKTLARIHNPRVIILEPVPMDGQTRLVSKLGMNAQDELCKEEWVHNWPDWCWDLGWKAEDAVKLQDDKCMYLGAVYNTGHTGHTGR